MAFANDKLYKVYLRPKMPTIASTVKVREIIPHLPCLTDHDRENIEAKRETYGNHDSMVLLLDCLKRRENWPDQFIAGLEACDHLTLAEEIRREYNSLRNGSSNFTDSSPSSPSATVVRAHVHPAPSAGHLPIPKSGGDSQATVSAPTEASAPPEASPTLQEIPVQPQAPQSSAGAAPEDDQLSNLKVAPTPSTPPPSPEKPHTRASTSSPPPEQKIISPQEPVEDSESDIQVVSHQVNAGNTEVDTPLAPPQNPSLLTDGPSVPVKTPEKAPVQDTTPPVDLRPAAALEPEENSEPPDTQAPAASAAPSSAVSDALGMDSSLFDNTMCVSKPGELLSIQLQSPTHNAPDLPAEPYSGNSERLEFSSVSACTAVNPTTSTLTCQENGITPNHNEPEENHYESLCSSLEVQENVVQICEEPSILNLDGQSAAPQPQITNGKTAKEITSAPPLPTSAAATASSTTPPSVKNHHPSEPALADVLPELKTLQTAEETASTHTLSTNTKYIITAAGVGACALLMAWKFKH